MAPIKGDLAVMVVETAAGRTSSQALFEAFLVAKLYCERPEQPGFLAIGEPPHGLVPVFTSLTELAAFAGECDWFSTSGKDLLSLLPAGYDLVVDPAGAHPVRLRSAAWQAQPELQIEPTRTTQGREGT